MKPRILLGLLLCLSSSWRGVILGAGESALRAYVLEKEHRQAYGVYMKNVKFGWAINEFKLGVRDGEEAARQRFEMHVSFSSAGERVDWESSTITYFGLQGAGEIIGAEERVVQDGAETVRTAFREGACMVITTRSGHGESKRSLPVPKETLESMRRLDRWLNGSPRRGARFESYATSWDQDDIDTQEVYTFRGKKTILWGGIKIPVFRVMLEVEGMTLHCELNSDGTPLRTVVGGVFKLRAQKEALAKMPGTESFDMLEVSSIHLDKDLGDAATIRCLTLRIQGAGDFPFPVSHRQRIVSRRGGSVVVEILADGPVETPMALSRADKDQYLKTTVSVQSDAEALRQMVGDIAGGQTDLARKAELLQRWVFTNIRQTMAANASTALDVLNHRAGDCTEITLLFVAMARAAGIPAREVGGVMYVNEGRPVFGWHAWAEIHDGHQWISMDPTWNQVYADATHIKLAEGPNDWTWMNLLGKLKVQVLKVSRDKL